MKQAGVVQPEGVLVRCRNVGGQLLLHALDANCLEGIQKACGIARMRLAQEMAHARKCILQESAQQESASDVVIRWADCPFR